MTDFAQGYAPMGGLEDSRTSRGGRTPQRKIARGRFGMLRKRL